jgi:hypothetical protein
MKLNHIIITIPAVFLIFNSSMAIAGKTINQAGALVCITDKWEEKELEKGHKLADWAGRCIGVPDNPALEKSVEDCVEKYEYMPDQSWKGTGTCTRSFKSGDKIYKSFEEGSHLKVNTYNITSGTGKYKDAKGSGTYSCDSLNDTLCGGRFKDKIQLH